MSALLGSDAAWNGRVSARNHIGVEVRGRRNAHGRCADGRSFIRVRACAVRNEGISARHVVVVSFDRSAVFFAECGVVIACRGRTRVKVATLHRGEHRVFAVTEVVAFHEDRRAFGAACAILCIAIVVVVVNVGVVVAHTRVTAIGMIVPVVVIGDVVVGGIVAVGTFGKAEKVTFAVVPEVVIAEGDVRRFFAVERTVSLCLVGVGTRIAVEEVHVVHPNVSVVLLKTDVVTFIAIHIHNAEIANFHVLRVL